MIKILDLNNIEISHLEIGDFGSMNLFSKKPQTSVRVSFDVDGFSNTVKIDGEDYQEILNLVKEKILYRLNQSVESE